MINLDLGYSFTCLFDEIVIAAFTRNRLILQSNLHESVSLMMGILKAVMAIHNLLCICVSLLAILAIESSSLTVDYLCAAATTDKCLVITK